MTKTYHDIEAVTRLLQEKENDLELAAKIGQELLDRNRRLEERVNGLELQLNSSNELITQLRHDLVVKTDLLHVYTNDAIEDSSSPVESKVNLDTLQRKIRDLEDENKRLHAEATELAQEAMACEAKEEKLVTDAVKHLTEANVQINYLSKKFTNKSDESQKQREEIRQLLAQVCDLQSKWKKTSSENEDHVAQLRIYKETQEELTSELADFKEKYREIVDLLHDTQNELKAAKKRSYPGIGEHKVSGMFESDKSRQAKNQDGSGADSSRELSLQSEIHSSIRAKKKLRTRTSQLQSQALGGRGASETSTDLSDSDLEVNPGGLSSAYKSTFDTFRLATANKMHIGGLSSDSPIPTYNPGLGSSLESAPRILRLGQDQDAYSYTISRDNSQSPSAFMIDLDENYKTKTSDTLTMTPAGGHKRPIISSVELQRTGSSMSLDSRSRQQLQFDSEDPDGEFSIPEFGSGKEQSLPGLGSLECINIASDSQRPLAASGLRPQRLGSVPELGAMSRQLRLGSVPGDIFEPPGRRADLGCVPSNAVGKPGMRPDLGTVPFAFEDSGIESSEFQDMLRLEGDGKDQSGSGSESIPELEEALLKLTPQEVEQRRKRMFSMSRYSYELGSDGFTSPGSSIFGKPGFNFLPYGVRTPDSLMSTGSRDMTGSYLGSYGGASWKLPDKLRIVKPLEGSLTLHQWQRLAKPSLGGIFEERKGIVMRGSRVKDMIISEEDQMSDLELDNNEDESDIAFRLQTGATRLQQTLTNSKIIHPDLTDVTSSYRSGSRMSTSIMSSRRSSRRSSVSSSMDDLRMDFGTSTFSTNLGLANVLNERNIHGGSTLSLDQISMMGDHPNYGSLKRIRTGSVSEVASICSLTPSVVHSPNKHKSFSPTGTPLNSPDASRPSSPSRIPALNPEDSPGFVLGFFASVRAALYGEQQKEVMTMKKKKVVKKRLGILKKVKEVGPERFLSPAPLTEESEAEESVVRPLNQDWDELMEIQPGTLTISRGMKPRYTSGDLYGELKPPDPKISDGQSGRGPGRIISPGDKRPGLPGAYGVPGRTGTGALTRKDLGSVPDTSGASLIRNAERLKSKPSEDNSFIGTMASMFFGRKGGLL